MQPQKYERITDFTEREGDDTDHSALNDEFDAAALTTDQIRANLALIQRDDGQLKNGIVTADALAPSAFDAVQASVNEATAEAEAAALSALTSATTANTAKDAAVVAKTQAETARDSSNLNAANAAASAAAALSSKNSASSSEAAALSSKNAAAASETAAGASATSASGSASTATAQAGIATTKAGEAAASQVAAAASSGTATTKAAEASASAADALASKNAAAASQTAAAASAATSTTKAGEASASAAAALASQTASATSEAAALASKNAAATSETNALASKNAAATSEANALTYKNAAQASQTAAAASETGAAGSASSAAASAAAAAASLDNFDDRYLGSKASAPTLDNDGNALLVGALYYNDGTIVSDNKGMWTYDGATWIKASSASQAILVVYKFVATAGQTIFSGVDTQGLTLGYQPGSVLISMNGPLIDIPSEVVASTGNSVVLTSGAAAGDEIKIYSYSTFNIANTYTQVQTDALLAGKVSKAGDTITGELVVQRADSNNIVRLKRTGSSAGEGYIYANDNELFGVKDAGIAYPFLVKRGAPSDSLTVDAAGRILMPKQPAFRAGSTAPDATVTFAANAKLTFLTTASLNRGNHYDAANSRFVAPVAGVYCFSAHFWVDGSSQGSLSIRVNGGQPKGGNGDSCTTNEGGISEPQRHISITLVDYLNANDQIEIYTRNTAWTGYSGHSWWQGFFLG